MLEQWHEEGGVLVMGYSMYRILAYNSKLKKKRLKRIFHSTLVNPGRFIYERCGIGYQGRIEKI